MCDPGTCIYGTCSAATGACDCSRGFFTAQSTNTSYDLCADSIQDVYPAAWILIRVLFAVLFAAASASAAVSLCRLRRQRLKARRTGPLPPCCNLRTHVFALLLAAASSRVLWLGLDPRGASFLLHAKMSSHAYPTYEERFGALLPVRFLDYTLLYVCYACMVSMNFAVVGFWVQVSLRFTATTATAKNSLKWRCFTRGIEALAWCTFLGLALVLVWSDSKAVVLIYNMQAMCYGIAMWIGMAVAYSTVYRHTMSNLTWLVAASGGSNSKKDKLSRKKYARQKKNLKQVTRLAFGSIGLLTGALLSLLAATAFDWTSRHLPYLVVVGVLYRVIEVAYMYNFLYILWVREKKNKKRERSRKKKKKKKKETNTQAGEARSTSNLSRQQQHSGISSSGISLDASTRATLDRISTLNAIEQLELELQQQASPELAVAQTVELGSGRGGGKS